MLRKSTNKDDVNRMAFFFFDIGIVLRINKAKPTHDTDRSTLSRFPTLGTSHMRSKHLDRYRVQDYNALRINSEIVYSKAWGCCTSKEVSPTLVAFSGSPCESQQFILEGF